MEDLQTKANEEAIVHKLIGINNEAINIEDINNMIEDLQTMMKTFVEMASSLNRPGDRRRRMGPGIRRYGFIDKTADLAAANPQFSPALFKASDLKGLLRDIEVIRNLTNLLLQFSRATQDSLLIYGDEAYSMALLYYHSVRELARRNVPGAEPVFRALEPFFRRSNSVVEEETAEPEMERDFKALLHGTKDGEVIVKN